MQIFQMYESFVIHNYRTTKLSVRQWGVSGVALFITTDEQLQ